MRGDNERMTGWPPDPSATRSPKHMASKRMRGLGIFAAAFVVLVVAALLAVYLSSVATPFIARDFAAAPTATTASWVATQEAALTPTSADWYTFANWEGGFQVDIPGVISSSHAYFINDFSGKGIDFYYMGAPISSPLQQREAQIWVKVLYSTKITDQNICPQGGTPVTLGADGKQGEQVPAWVRNEGRIVFINLVLTGMAIEILLDTRDNAQPALPRYGDIWRHMLASFAPLPNETHSTDHPCD